MSRVAKNHRILTCDGRESEFSGETIINLSDDTVFQFLNEECEGLSPASSIDDDDDVDDEGKQNRNEDETGEVEDDNFWEAQHQLLQSTVCRTSSLESKIRNITKETLKEAGEVCICGRSAESGCRKCLMAEVCRRLQNAGFDSAICKSKWKSSLDIPSGEHTFLDVIERSTIGKKEVRVIIELNLRAQFEMARANEEYTKLVKKVPEVFVGKVERLVGVVKIMCGAAKKCMKEKKMHMAPWRKQRYMQAKWLRTCERITLAFASAQTFSSGRPSRPAKSLLTLDFMDALHIPVVAVV